ncbi:hypothetical protein Tco_0061423, partial [Tanacetum coccineum]
MVIMMARMAWQWGWCWCVMMAAAAVGGDEGWIGGGDVVGCVEWQTRWKGGGDSGGWWWLATSRRQRRSPEIMEGRL